LEHFRKGSQRGCYDRATRNQWAVVDAHLHIRPFGGLPVPFDELTQWLHRAGILFYNACGIGQRLPVDSNCTYYLDCPGTPITPSIKNDMFNAQAVLDEKALMSTVLGPVVTLSMSFPDLDHPEKIVPQMKLLDKEFPGMFGWMGELNVVKQALFSNSQGYPVPLDIMNHWAPFMQELREKDIAVGFHSDLGNDAEPLKYLPLMDKILELYPDNKIVWLHLGGLSLQLNPLPPVLLAAPLYADEHADIIRERLRRHPNLMIDLAWDVLYKELYTDPMKRQLYVQLLDEFPTRFIPGTDFVAAVTKPEEEYRLELNQTSDIFKDVSDAAFRNIALGENYFRLRSLDYSAPPVC